YGVTGAFGDNYGGQWPTAEFAKNGIVYELSELHKSDLYLNLIPVLCSRKVELLDNEKLKSELRRLERRRGKSGRDTIDHPPRGSDDIANAVAGVVHLALEQCGDLEPYAYGTRTFARDSDWGFGVHDDLHPMDIILDRSRPNRRFWDA